MIAAAPEPKRNMGQPEPRSDGRLKVLGEARYPADVVVSNPAHAHLVTSAIAKGIVTAIDDREARAVPGVLDIFTHQNALPMNDVKPFSSGGYMGSSVRPFASNRIVHEGEIVAMVVADTFEAAREAAYRLRVTYAEETPSALISSPGVTLQSAVEAGKEQGHEDPKVGDAAVALAAADVRLEAEYATPAQHHNAIELFSATAAWSGDQLTVQVPSQFVYGFKNGLAEMLSVDPKNVQVVSRYIGGGFGGKGPLYHYVGLVAGAARRLNRAVQLVVTRDQAYTTTTYRAETRHRIKLGATKAGKLTAFVHEADELTSRPDSYMVAGADITAAMYACPNVSTKVTLVHADRNTPGFMRSPAEVPYMFALESAMDEMAEKLGIDPVEFRRMNDTSKNPVSGKPYTSRSLMTCYDQAAASFGWSKRDAKVASMRDGDWLVGYGCATATYPTQMAPSAVRVRLSPDGGTTVQVAAHDVGTGAYTVIGQEAASRLGVPFGMVKVELGDSNLPPGTVAGGSVTTASTCSAVMKACEGIREKLARAAVTAKDGPLAGKPVGSIRLEGGKVVGEGGSESLSEVFGRLGVGAVEEFAEWVPPGSKPGAAAGMYKGKPGIIGGTQGDKLMFAFGAEFVEVRVHARTREVHVPRIVGAFAAGRILNTRTARSQLMGGMIWGISSALHEETEIDARAGRYVNDNLAEYLVPVNADIRQVEVILVPEDDGEVNPAGVKGLGELGNVGTNAAVANAVYHATGKRVRELPVRIEKLL